MRSYVVVGAAILWTCLASAQEPAPAGQLEARTHFQRGLGHVKTGELERALQEFEAAYAAQPHFSVLYNIAQAQLALGKPVEAVPTLERYLAEGGERLSGERTSEVRALLESNRRRIGQLRISVRSAERTRVWLDGVELGKDKLGVALSTTVGAHTVLSSIGTGFPASQRVAVSAGQLTELSLQRGQESGLERALLAVTCNVPGVAIDVPGLPTRRTPLLQPLAVPVGKLLIQFTRPGYRSTAQTVTTEPSSLTTLSCNARPLPSLDAKLAARLDVATTPADAQIVVDGARFLGQALPAGAHSVHIERDGFVPHRATLELAPGRTLSYRAKLERTPAARQRWERATRQRHAAAYVLGGSGLAFLGLAGGLFAWNQGRYEDLNRQASSGQRDPQRVASIQRADDLSLGALALGAGLGAGAAWLFFTPPSDVE
jgi:hypothetical protein